MELIAGERLQFSDITDQEKQYVNGCRQSAEVPPFTTLSPKPYLRLLSTLLSTTCSSTQSIHPSKPYCDHTFVEILRLDQDDVDQPEPFTLSQMRALADDTKALLFLKGQPCSDWIRVMGAKLGISYDFFSEHLPSHEDFFYERSWPRPGSTIRLRLPTVGSRQLFRRKGDPVSYAELDTLRKAVDNTISEYFRAVAKDPINMVCGESLIRDMLIHDEQHFSIDQYVSIHICQRAAGWIGIVWTDVGYFDWKNTSELFSHLQPLSSYPALKTYPTVGLPVYSEDDSRQLEVQGYQGRLFQQTASVVLQHYGKQIDQDLVAQDPLTALFPIIQLCLAAESQYLRMIETKIGKGTELISLTAPRTGLSIVLETKQCLAEHLRDFQDLASFLRDHKQNYHAPTSRKESDTENINSLRMENKLSEVLSLVGGITSRTKRLIEECNYTVSNIQAAASLQQAERTIEEARGVKYLTVLAFFFAPLSFTTSFFGMNFAEFGSGPLSLYIWAVIAVPISVLFMVPFMSDFRNIGNLAAAKIRAWINPQ